VAGLLRFQHLDYSEFQGDEARAAMFACDLVQSGNPETLLWHKKGPLEILLPAAVIHQSNLDEGVLRLPFTIAGLAGVLAVVSLGGNFWNWRAGWTAAMLLAVNGFLVAFARIVQYQSIVLLFSVLAVGSALRFYRGGNGLLPASMFLGFGLLAHYEAIFAFPPIAWLVYARGRVEGWTWRQWLGRVSLPLVLLACIAMPFYLPFVCHPHFALTAAYIGGQRIGTTFLCNNLPDFLQTDAYYSSMLYSLIMAAGLIGVLTALLRHVWGRSLPVIAWLTALGALLACPKLFLVGKLSLAAGVLAAPFVVLAWSRRVATEIRAVLLWWAGPFLAAACLVQSPNTHFYTALPAWALLAGWGVDRAARWLEERIGKRNAYLGLGSLAAGLGGVFCSYQYVMFVRHVPEHRWAAATTPFPGFGRSVTGPALPSFGFPYRAGWNTVRQMFVDGTLAGTYNSNEKEYITAWYTWGATRTTRDPRYYLLVWQAQGSGRAPYDILQRDYHLRATVRVHGQEKLWVYDREPPATSRLVFDEHDGNSTPSLGIGMNRSDGFAFPTFLSVILKQDRKWVNQGTGN
jgi:hypothetical protein